MISVFLPDSLRARCTEPCSPVYSKFTNIEGVRIAADVTPRFLGPQQHTDERSSRYVKDKHTYRRRFLPL